MARLEVLARQDVFRLRVLTTSCAGSGRFFGRSPIAFYVKSSYVSCNLASIAQSRLQTQAGEAQEAQPATKSTNSPVVNLQINHGSTCTRGRLKGIQPQNT